MLTYFNQVFLAGTTELAGKISNKLFDKKTSSNSKKGEPLRKLSVDKSYLCDNSPERAEKVAETLVKNWEIAHTIAEANGIKFVAIWQPVAFIGNPRLDHLDSLWNPKWEEELRLQHKSVYPFLKQIIQARGHKWILDYTEIYSGNEYIYWDYCHVSQNGHLLVAKQLYADLKPNLK
ncbi:MAG: hypothetical protein WBA93_08305 [Microcoleaceae cyanobacterium]